MSQSESFRCASLLSILIIIVIVVIIVNIVAIILVIIIINIFVFMIISWRDSGLSSGWVISKLGTTVDFSVALEITFKIENLPITTTITITITITQSAVSG